MTFIEVLMLWFMAATSSHPNGEEVVLKLPGVEIVAGQREGDNDEEDEEAKPVFEKIHLGRPSSKKISNGL